MNEALWYELRNAVYAKEFGIAESLLKANPHLTDLRDGIGETVLHFLAVENDAEGVAWLHNGGSDLDTKNKFGTPVVFEVAELGYTDLLLWFAQRASTSRHWTVMAKISSAICESMRKTTWFSS